MSVTHGGRAKHFTWSCQQGRLVIKNEDGKVHSYSVAEIGGILDTLLAEFGSQWIPLANNVQKLHEGTEIPGLGSTICRLHPGDIFHAQGASYLGVVLEEAGLLEWNGKALGIKWRIVADRIDDSVVQQSLEKQRAGNEMTRSLLPATEREARHGSYTIDTHKHNFAVWAASRAAQRGFLRGTVENFRDAMEGSGISEEVARIAGADVGPMQYDAWHRDLCRRIVKYLMDAGISDATYGRAAKLVAVYLKVVVIIGGDPICPLARVAHPPIDSILLRNIAKANPSLRSLAQARWTGLSEADYFDIVNKLRRALGENRPFWEIEKHWTVTNS